MIRALVFDFFGTIRSEDKLNQDLLDYVLELKKTHKTALLSNVIDSDKYFDMPTLSRYFDVIAPSDKIGFVKPDPESYTYVLSKLGVKPEEAVMIDDLPPLVLGAEQIGMQGIVFQNLGQLKPELGKILNVRS